MFFINVMYRIFIQASCRTRSHKYWAIRRKEWAGFVPTVQFRTFLFFSESRVCPYFRSFSKIRCTTLIVKVHWPRSGIFSVFILKLHSVYLTVYWSKCHVSTSNSAELKLSRGSGSTVFQPKRTVSSTSSETLPNFKKEDKPRFNSLISLR